jgi:hypothetical protein
LNPFVDWKAYADRSDIFATDGFTKIDSTSDGQSIKVKDENSLGVVKLDDGSKLTIAYSLKYDMMVFEAKVERGSFLAMGFGHNMDNTEMAIWHAYGDGSW